MPDPDGARVLAKVEMLNPGGSVKDRIGASMLDAAESSGRLRPGGTVVECTSGNTGVGLALNCAVRGYRLICTMPDKMSQEKVRLLRALGAEVIVTPTAVPADHPDSYYSVARRIAETTDNCVWTNQYFNDANPLAHYRSTGPEIWAQTAGRLDAFVAGMGTCGTVSGVGRYLKEQRSDLRVVAVDPVGSSLKHWFDTGETVEGAPYQVEGIGEDIIPSTFHRQWIDEVRSVDDRTSFVTARRLMKEEGIFAGGSSGAAVAVALEVARPLGPEATVVVLLPDSGDRYVSRIYDDDWMRENRYLSREAATAAEVLAAKPSGPPSLLTVEADRPAREAVEIMRRHRVSQLPVLAAGEPVGKVTEGRLFAEVLDDPSRLDAPVSRFQEPPLPRIDAGRSTAEILRLLGGKDAAVLVEEHGRPVGILTRFDLIDHVQPSR
jgi:cystathionine beta-synthase